LCLPRTPTISPRWARWSTSFRRIWLRADPWRSISFEELIAEISAAYLCASLSITPTVRHADYIASWLDVLREDNRAVVRAASAASKAADYILAFQPDAPPSVEATSADDEREAA
jgi:antirestriction protein ArdC